MAQLEAYRIFTGQPTPVRELKDHFVVSAQGVSKCIGIAMFKFPYAGHVIQFDAPIVENIDTPLIIGLSDQDKLGSRGVDQKSNTIVLVTALVYQSSVISVTCGYVGTTILSACTAGRN